MGLILPKDKAVFVHIPRSGGMWVEKALKAASVECFRDTIWRVRGKKVRRGLRLQEEMITPRFHTMPQQWKLRDWRSPPIPRPMFRWAIVRHPIAYHESQWRFMTSFSNWEYERKRMRIRHRWHPQKPCWLATEGLERDDFNGWVKRMMSEYGNWITRLFEVYVGPSGGEWVEFIGRTETLVPDLARVLRRLGYKDIDRSAFENMRIAGRRPKIRGIEWEPGLKEKVLENEWIAIQRWYTAERKNRRWYGREYPRREKFYI